MLSSLITISFAVLSSVAAPIELKEGGGSTDDPVRTASNQRSGLTPVP